MALKDIRAAEAMLDVEDEDFYTHSAFWCQQSIEKSIKGYLAFHKTRFQKIHVLSKLVSLAMLTEDDLSVLSFDHERITDFATKHRYPGADIAPVYRNELGESIELAKLILKELSTLVLTQELPLDVNKK